MMSKMRHYQITCPDECRVFILSPVEQRILQLQGRLTALCLHADRAITPDAITQCADDLRSLMTEAYPQDWADEAAAALREADEADEA